MTNFESILGRVALALLALGFFLPSVAREELYSTTFEDEDEFNTWTIVDMNGGRSWEFLSDHGNGVAAYMHDKNDLPGDDWYISPGISMEVDNIYELVFTFGVKTRVENMSVWVGSSLYPDDFTIELHDFNSVTSDDSGTYTYKFTVPESGEWHIGFYAYSEPNTHRVQIDDVIVNYVSSALVPGEVTDLTIVAGEKASKNATISFVTPAVSILGEALLEPSNIIIKRNAGASAIANFENVGEGEVLSYVDEDAEYGLNVYNIIAYNSYGESEVAVDSVWVGHDTAVAVSELSVRLTPELEVLLEWAEPTSSVHGGYVDYESLTYTISCEGQTVAEGVSGVSYTYSADSRSQTLISFIITPVSEGGEGESAQSVNLLYGEPLFPPYSESFAGCEFEGIEWYQDETCCDFVWQLDTDDDNYEIYPYDSDGGMLRAYRSSWWPGKQSRVISPLFYLDGMKNPTLSFYLLYLQSPYYDYALDGVITDRVQVQVSIDGGEWEDVNNACFIYGQESLGWTLCQVMLPRSEGSFVQIAFLALPESEGSRYRD